MTSHRQCRLATGATVVAAGLCLATVLWGRAVGAEMNERAVSPEQASHLVAATDVRTHGGVVTGKIVNNSDDSLRDVRLLIDHAWLWRSERRPGHNDPSRADFYTVSGEIPPHGTVSFEYRTEPPLPARHDGSFRTIVRVSSFTQVGS